MSIITKCENCGAPRKNQEKVCPYCQSPYPDSYANSTGYTRRQSTGTTPPIAQKIYENFQESRQKGANRRVLIAIFAFTLATFGVPFFMLRNNKMGIFCIIMSCCTGGALAVVPFIIGIILGVNLLTMSDSGFEEKYGISSQINN